MQAEYFMRMTYKVEVIAPIMATNMSSPMDTKYIRQLNCAKIFRVVREREPVSRAEISRITQLSPSTVSEAALMLLKAGFINEAESGDSNGGRPPIMLRINANRGYVIGIDLDVGRFTTAIGDLHLSVMSSTTTHLASSDYEYVIKELKRTIEEQVRALGIEQEKLLGIGIGVPGQVGFKKGVLKYAPNMGWTDVPLGEDLEKAINVPVHIDNDAKLSAIGEKWFGVGQKATEIVFVTVKTGIGCGIIIDGAIHRGIDGSAGELGHMSIDASGPRCACGNFGCWETFADENAIIGRALRELSSNRTSELFKRCGGDARRLTIKDIVVSALDGDPAAIRIVKETSWYLGIGITNIVNAFNPELVIVGGQITGVGNLMFDQINQVVQERALGVPKNRVRILPSMLDNKSCVMGCLAAVVEEQLEDPRTLAFKMREV